MKSLLHAGLLVLWATLVAAQTPTPSAVQATQEEDRFVAGSSLRIADRTAGDLIAAGGRLEIAAPVDGDALLAGGELRVAAALGRSAYLAGGRVLLDGELARHLRAAGGQVEVGPAARVAGNATLFGGDVSVRGPVRGSLRVAGGRVLIDSAVDGAVDASGGTIELGPNARIGGALRWRSSEGLQRHPAAQVTGSEQRLTWPGRGEGDRAREHREQRGAFDVAAGAWWTLGLMLVAAVTIAAAPSASARLALTWRERTGWSLLAGFIALVCVPVAALILLVTVIGAPLALLVLLLYLALLPLGYVLSAVAIGQWGLARWKADGAERLGWRIGAAVLALLLMAVMARVPWLGGLVAFAALLAGLGAIILQLWPRRAGAASP
jgi:hypothetical protein